MITTYSSYNMITRDIGKSLTRVEKQPIVQRDTEYYLANIGKVKSAEELVKDHRLFSYAMKAHGLEDMTYAKAFMLKALNEGIAESDSFANKLTDKRYADFVRSFNFEAYGEATTTYNAARDATMKNYLARATGSGTFPPTESAKKEMAYFQEKIGEVKSIDDLIDNPRLLEFSLRAFNIEKLNLNRTQLQALLEGGVSEPDSPANKHRDENVARFVAAFNFAELGEKTTSYVASKDSVTSQYMRQTLERDAGVDNEGVRLALYFERKASEITSFYQILGDPALSEVLRTALGFPAAMGQADIDMQVKAYEKRMSIEDLADPKKLEKFLQRFTVMWDINNTSPESTSPALALISQPPQFGISIDTMMAITRLKI